jgi:sec-independent protein translocase protein TatA
MFGLGIWEIVGIALILLLLFGPSRLPNLGKSLGESIRGFKTGLKDDTSEANRPKIEDDKNKQS